MHTQRCYTLKPEFGVILSQRIQFAVFIQWSECISTDIICKGQGLLCDIAWLEASHHTPKRWRSTSRSLLRQETHGALCLGCEIGDQAGVEARSIVHWYRILCDSDDVDAEWAESLFNSVAGVTLALTRNARTRGHDITKNHLLYHFGLSIERAMCGLPLFSSLVNLGRSLCSPVILKKNLDCKSLALLLLCSG